MSQSLKSIYLNTWRVIFTNKVNRLREPEELKHPDFQALSQQYALRPKLYGMSGWISISGSLIVAAAEPGRAADAAGAARGLGAIYPPKCYGLLATRRRATSSRLRQPEVPGAPQVGRTHIAWHLSRAAVLHPSHACQRRS